jgi:hypothetical protein
VVFDDALDHLALVAYGTANHGFLLLQTSEDGDEQHATTEVIKKGFDA